MCNQKKDKTRTARWYHTLITLAILIAAMLYVVVFCGGTPQLPLLIGCVTAAIVCAALGYRWEEILRFAVEGITPALEALMILLLIGILVGVWIMSGTVPALVYYGLCILNARFFLPASALICGIVSFAIGAWGTVGTVGIALMGIGTALGIPLPMIAGSIVSGAYFGDAASPLSDAVNLSAAVVGEGTFPLVKDRIAPTFAAFGTALAGFLLLGLSSPSADPAKVAAVVEPLKEQLRICYSISPLDLIPLAAVIICVLMRFPAIPATVLGIAAGIVSAILFQGASPKELVFACTEGCVSTTGIELLDTLFTAGGIFSMMNTVSIAMIAMAFGGIMQRSGQMRAIVRPLLGKLHGFGMMNGATVLSCVLMNVVLPDQSLSISVPGQMLQEEYDSRGYGRPALGTGLVGASATSPIVPWNTCGLYCLAILGVSAKAYFPFAFYNLLAVLFTILFGFLRARKQKT